MNDPNTVAIAEVLRRWYANEPAPNVIPFPTPSERQQRESRKWMRTYTRPIGPTEPRPAA